jgi:hypothetical protein
MQFEATRALLHTQARAAAAFGWPDMSNLFDQADERARHAFAAGADQVLNAAQRASEVASELQRQIGRVVETQTATAAENWQRGIEEIGAQADEGFAQLCETARQQADEAQRMTEQLAQETREGIQRGGEHLRSQMHEGAQRVREASSAAGEEKNNKHRHRAAA